MPGELVQPKFVKTLRPLRKMRNPQHIRGGLRCAHRERIKTKRKSLFFALPFGSLVKVVLCDDRLFTRFPKDVECYECSKEAF